MTGQQLYEGWLRAAAKVHPFAGLRPWDELLPMHAAVWEGVAEMIDKWGPPTSAQVFVNSFGSFASPDPMVMKVAEDFIANWTGYFNFTESVSSDHAKGDTWLFKASGLKAKVMDVDGTKVKLAINGVETDWVEAEELAKNAKKV